MSSHGVVEGELGWQRLDAPGRDRCSLRRTVAGYTLEGVAFFQLESAPTELRYAVHCAASFCTRRAQVSGTVGLRAVAFEISKSARGWLMNGAAVPGLDDCFDLDLGFTPATNLLAIRRLALLPGQAAEAPAAWLDAATGTMTRLPQRYGRRGHGSYWYEAPSVGYAAELTVNETGFVVDYPGLWRATADRASAR